MLQDVKGQIDAVHPMVGSCDMFSVQGWVNSMPMGPM
jgi:hypothetical protein